MLHILRYFTEALVSLLIIALAAPVLFWLGRPLQESRGEMVVDADLLVDDAGVDVDLYEVN